jgi:hypothetical protein
MATGIAGFPNGLDGRSPRRAQATVAQGRGAELSAAGLDQGPGRHRVRTLSAAVRVFVLQALIAREQHSAVGDVASLCDGSLTINRLAQRDIEAMIDRVVGNKSIPASVRHDIIERTDVSRAADRPQGEASSAACCAATSMAGTRLHCANTRGANE